SPRPTGRVSSGRSIRSLFCAACVPSVQATSPRPPARVAFGVAILLVPQHWAADLRRRCWALFGAVSRPFTGAPRVANGVAIGSCMLGIGSRPAGGGVPRTLPTELRARARRRESQQFMKDEYPDSKSDLFAGFIERCVALTAPRG